MKIEEGNVLIAKYMGIYNYDAPRWDVRCTFKLPEYEGEHDVFYANELEYHKNWNWLMPVVQKIGYRVRLIEYEGHNLAECFVELKQALYWGESIVSVWSSVIEVIKYLNTIDNEN